MVSILFYEMIYQQLGNRNINTRSAQSRHRGHVAETPMVSDETVEIND